jgi:protein TonB
MPPAPVVPPKVAPVAKALPVLTKETTPSPDADAMPAPSVPAPSVAAVEKPPQQVDPRPAYDPEMTKIYLAGIKDRVQDKVIYPSLSLRRGETGIVHVQTFLFRDGQVKEALAEDDGISNRLKEAAIKAVKDASPYPHLPDAVPGEPVKVTIPVVFEIR